MRDGNQPAGESTQRAEGRGEGPHQGYSVCVAGDRTGGHGGSPAEGPHLLLGLSRHAPTLCIPPLQVLRLESHLQVLLQTHSGPGSGPTQ